MKKFYFLIVLLFNAILGFSQTQSYSNAFYIIDPSNLKNASTGYLTNVKYEIEPKGLYAIVSIDFYVGASNQVMGPNPLQAIFHFSLPANSFITDSWLWLNDTDIIRADIIEKGLASQIFNGTITRKRDPSLLTNTGNTLYELQVYPVFDKYPRRVKLTYYTPFFWWKNKSCINLPFWNFEYGGGPVDLKIHFDNTFKSPKFSEASIVNFMTSNPPGIYNSRIPYSTYSEGLTLCYDVSNTGALIDTFRQNTSEGMYQVVIPELEMQSPRHLTIVLDPNNSMTSKFRAILKSLRSFLLTNYNNADSFNIFYWGNSGVTSTTTAWQAMDSLSICNAISSIPPHNNKNISSYYQLLSVPITFSKTRSGARCLLISDNPSANNSKNTIDTLQKLTGGLTSTIDIINYYPAFNSLYAGLSNLTNGTYLQYPADIQVGFNLLYDFDIQNALRFIAHQNSNSSNLFQVELPLNNGLTYENYNIERNSKLYTTFPTAITGKYLGSFQNGNLKIKYLSSSGFDSVTMPIHYLDGDSGIRKAWTYNKIMDLQKTGNTAYSETLDSSLKNRILCNYTAFLALETGDTIHESIDEAFPLKISTEKVTEAKCYPNPFYKGQTLTIETITPFNELRIYDLMGKEINTFKPSYASRFYVWNGKDSNGLEVPPGVYLIRLIGRYEISSIKVEKAN